MTIGDRVRLNAAGIKWLGGYPKEYRRGVVVGRSRQTAKDQCLWVLWDGLKTRQKYAVEFLELAE